MATGKEGCFREIDPEMAKAIREIMGRKSDAEIRRKKDGSYDVFEVKRTKHTPRKDPGTE